MTVRIAIPDMISPTSSPRIAAMEMGLLSASPAYADVVPPLCGEVC